MTGEPEDGDRLRYNFQSLHDLNRDAEAIIGDAIGNLRSTLDYIVGALIYPITGKRKDTGFPFADKANDFASRVRQDSAFGLLPEKLQNAIISDVQAYKGGAGETLWALNKLRNIDKHRLLVTTQRVASIILSFRDANHNVFHHFEVGIPEGQKTTAISAPMNHIQITSEPRPTFEIRIQEPESVEGAEALSFLQACANQVNGVLKTVEVALG